MERDALRLSFAPTSQRVLNRLQSEIPLASWMITRVVGDEWVMLAVRDTVYGIQPGMSFRWIDSYCSQMVQGRGPNVAARAQSIEVYRRAPVNLALHIEAYVGVPIYLSDGTFFGTLCAIDPLEQQLDPIRTLRRLKDAAQAVGESLANDLVVLEDALEQYRGGEGDGQRACCEIMNERDFRAAVELEERLCADFGGRCVVGATMLDGDDLGWSDRLSGRNAGQRCRAVAALRRVMKPSDLLGDLGGGVIALLFVGIGREEAVGLRSYLETVLRGSGLRSTVYVVPRRRDGTTSRSLGCALELARSSRLWRSASA